jgi:hypothetical protein
MQQSQCCATAGAVIVPALCAQRAWHAGRLVSCCPALCKLDITRNITTTAANPEAAAPQTLSYYRSNSKHSLGAAYGANIPHKSACQRLSLTMLPLALQAACGS